MRGTHTWRDLFNEPSDLAIAPNGDLYVADGHINPQSNRRIVHLTNDGEFIEQFGAPGTGPGQFDNPHSLAVAVMTGINARENRFLCASLKTN